MDLYNLETTYQNHRQELMREATHARRNGQAKSSESIVSRMSHFFGKRNRKAEAPVPQLRLRKA